MPQSLPKDSPCRLKAVIRNGLMVMLLPLVLLFGVSVYDQWYSVPPESIAQAGVLEPNATDGHLTRESNTAGEATSLQAPSVSFVAFGDTGSGAPQQMDIARQMLTLYGKSPYSSVLVLGDILYPDGDVKQYGKSRYLDVYAPLMKQGVEFVEALGNHDVLRGNVQEQLKFYEMPARYYQYDVPAVKVPDENATAHANHLKQSDAPLNKSAAADPQLVTIFVLDTNTFSKDQVQQTWLEQGLSKSKARWNIVAGHHPLYTSGAHHGEGLIEKLKPALEPILVKHRVPLYLAGHDHDYERFTPIRGVTHIISGGGGAWVRKFDAIQPGSAVHQAVNHFLHLTATSNTLTIQAINRQGQPFDQVTLKK